MVFKELKKEDGYTIVEILIALSIISIVLALVSSVFVFVNQQMIDWKADLDFYNNYHIVQNKVFNDILTTNQIMVNDTSLVLINGTAQEKKYTWSKGTLKYNSNVFLVSDIDSLVLNIEPSEEVKIMERWTLLQKEGGKEFEQDFVLSVRKPQIWTPLRQNAGASF